MSKILATTIAISVLLSSTAAFASDSIQAGKTISLACTGCHGARGISSNPKYPNLAGQTRGYLVKSLREFRSGQRKDPSMNRIANPLSDADIANLSAYYASLRR